MAGATSDDLANLIVSVSADLTKYQKEMEKMAGVTARAAKAASDAFAAANDNMVKKTVAGAKQMQRSIGAVNAETSNMAAQFQDIAVQLQGGGSPLTVALQQGQQLATVFQGIRQQGGGIGQGLLGAFQAFLNPITAITVGVIALGGYLVQSFLNGTKSVEDTTKALEDLQKIAQQTGATDLEVAVGIKLDQAQINKAVNDLQKQIEDQLQTLGTEPGKASKFLDQFAKDFFDFSKGPLDISFATAPIDKLADTIGNLMDRAVERGPDAIATVTKLGDAYDDLNKAIATRDFDAAAEAMERLSSIDLRALGDGAAVWTAAMKDAIPAVKGIIDGIKLMVDAQTGAITRQNQFNDAMKTLAGVAAGPAIDEATKAMQAYASAVRLAGDDVLKLAEAKATLDTQLGNMGAAAWAKLPEVIDASTSSADNFAKMMGAAEGTAKNAASSASGFFQFLEGTWLEQVEKMHLGIGKTKQEILDMRNDPVVARGVFEHFTAENVAQLREGQVAINDTTKAMAHLLGAAGAIATLKAPPGTLLKDVVGDAPIKANKNLLSMTQTVEQATAAISAFYLKRRQNIAPTTSEDLIRSGEQLLATTQAEIAIQNDKTKSYVEQQGAIARLRAEEAARAALLKENSTLSEANNETIKKAGQLAYEAAAATAADTETKRNNKVWTDLQSKSQIDAAKSTEDLRKQQEKNAQLFAQIGTSFIQTFVSGLRQGKDAADSMKDALIQLADQILSMILNKSLTSLGNALFPTAMSGGPVSGLGVKKSVSPFAFVGAPRMARGGFLGVGPGEIPIIAHRGEVVIPASMVRQAARMGSGSSGQGGTSIRVGDIAVSTNIDGTGDVKADTQRGKQIGLQLKALITTEIQRQSRPGGLLTAQGSGFRVGR